MQYLTENSIKQAAVRFLKTYYKFRPRSGDTVANYDLEASGGIIADGHISFPKDDGSTFTATFEATSHATVDEVKYRLQYGLLFWDSLAVSSIITAFLASLGYTYYYEDLKALGLLTTVALFLLVLLLVAFVYFLSVKSFSRYHYIYAIEQFKRYYADEQWIALAEDAFESPEDPYLKELKDQCVYNGFGLILVDTKGEPHLHITPSRVDLFQNRRKLAFVTRYAGATTAASLKKVEGLIRKTQSKWIPIEKSRSLLRYSRSYFKQVILVFLGLGLTASLFYRQYQDRDIVYMDDRKYQSQLDQAVREVDQEPTDFLIDTPYIHLNNPPAQPYTGMEEDDEDFGQPPVHNEVAPPRKEQARGTDILIPKSDNTAFTYDCARFYNFRGSVFLVQDDLFRSMSSAEERLQLLHRNGIDANILWLGCFSSNKPYYLVYYDLMYPQQEEALVKLEEYRRILKQMQIPSGNSLVRELFRKS